MIKVGSSISVTYADSDEQGNLINHRDYTGTVEKIDRGVEPGKRTKAKGTTSAGLILLKTDKGYRSLYHARITDIRLA